MVTYGVSDDLERAAGARRARAGGSPAGRRSRFRRFGRGTEFNGRFSASSPRDATKWTEIPARFSHDDGQLHRGYDVVRTFGVVRGIVVRSRSIFGSFGAVLQTMRGGNISLRFRSFLRANAGGRVLARDGACARARGECAGSPFATMRLRSCRGFQKCCATGRQ